MIVLDGLGDRPTEALSGQTPLEFAYIPTMDALAARGQTGFISALDPWVPVGTQTGMGMLLGLAKADAPLLTRGPVEAAGSGLSLKPGDVAIRCNLATLSPNGAAFDLVDRRAGRISEGVAELLEPVDGLEVAPGITVRAKPSTHHRAVIALVGEGLSDRVTDTDPGAGFEDLGVLKCEPRDRSEAALKTASAVNAFIGRAYEVMDTHPINREREERGATPANGLITRGAGMVFSTRNLISHLALKAAVVTGEGTVVGLGRLFGFDVTTKPSFTAGPDTDIDGKLSAALDALQTNDLAFVHIKATDVLAHDGDSLGKARFLEKFDAALASLDLDEVVVGITGDHTTDSNSGRHSGDPVPTLIVSPEGRRDRTDTFSESGCLNGGLGYLSATSFLCCMLDLMNCMHIHKGYEHFFYS
jgi:2,3-bisphosphoglycerate-independent phosphoglycerate mutase